MENPTQYIESIKNANIDLASNLQNKIINNINNLNDESYADIKHVNLILTTIIVNGKTWPIDKSSRWLGFVQAKLIQHNIITLDGERGDTRNVFHKIYQNSGINIPKSIDLYNKK